MPSLGGRSLPPLRDEAKARLAHARSGLELLDDDLVEQRAQDLWHRPDDTTSVVPPNRRSSQEQAQREHPGRVLAHRAHGARDRLREHVRLRQVPRRTRAGRGRRRRARRT